MQLADAMLTRFEDPQHGGFFFTSHDHEALIQRSKVAQDNASPSGNGMAAQTLQRLSLLTGETKYSAAAERCLKLYLPALEQAGSYHSSLCTALAEHLHPASLLVLCGPAGEVANWQAALRSSYLPEVMLLALTEKITGLPGALNKPVTETTTAWLCQGAQCLPPITALEELRSALQA